ncbi:25811_t:CDS:2, partial [Racocetra persica]
DVIISLPTDITAFADKIIWANMNATLSEKEHSRMYEISNSYAKFVDASQFWTGNAMIVVT